MKSIKKIYKAKKINMGGVFLDQALPIDDLTYADPFLLIHHWKQVFEGGQIQSELGVGPHPHKGFTPVTLIFEGGVYHQDSEGNKSLVEKGGTQWMNSGNGIIHSERPSAKLAKAGGEFEIIQFWVNIPSKLKYEKADYQALNKYEMPEIVSDGGLVKVGVVAGSFMGVKSILKTHSEMLILRTEFSKGGSFMIPVPNQYTTLLYQLDGKLKLNDKTVNNGKELVQFNEDGGLIRIEALEDSRAIILSGMPLNEAMYSYGPFVMNNKEQIYEAINEYQSGKFGKLIEEFDIPSKQYQ